MNSTQRLLEIIYLPLMIFYFTYTLLEVKVVSSEVQRFEQKHEERLHHNENVEAIQLLDNMSIARRLQRKKTFELV
jgi:hypothetical protein